MIVIDIIHDERERKEKERRGRERKGKIKGGNRRNERKEIPAVLHGTMLVCLFRVVRPTVGRVWL